MPAAAAGLGAAAAGAAALAELLAPPGAAPPREPLALELLAIARAGALELLWSAGAAEGPEKQNATMMDGEAKVAAMTD